MNSWVGGVLEDKAVAGEGRNIYSEIWFVIKGMGVRFYSLASCLLKYMENGNENENEQLRLVNAVPQEIGTEQLYLRTRGIVDANETRGFRKQSFYYNETRSFKSKASTNNKSATTSQWEQKVILGFFIAER